MISMLLAAMLVTSYPDPTVAGGTVYLSPPDRMPTGVPALGTDDRIGDAMMVGNPQMYQRQPYDFNQLEEKYPIQRVVPPAQQFERPAEQQMAIDQYNTAKLENQTQIKGQQLNQQLAQSKFTYDNSVIDQASKALGELGKLNPTSPNFEEQAAGLRATYPLAFQNEGFRSQVNKLFDTHDELKQNNQILDRHAQWQNEAQQQDARQAMASSAPEDIAMFDELVSKNPNAHPLSIAAQIVNQKQQQAAQRQLDAYGVKDYTPFRVDRSDPSSPLDLELVKGAIKQQATREAELNKPISREDYIAYARRLGNLTVDPVTKMATSPDKLDAADKAEYDFLQNQIRQFASQQRGSSLSVPGQQAQPQATPVQTLPPTSFFPKSSTKTGP